MIPRRPREIDRTYIDAMSFRVFDERAGRVEPHRLRIENRRRVLRRVVVPQIRRRVHDQCKTRRMTLGKSVVGKCMDLIVNAPADVFGNTVARHARDEFFADRGHPFG